jgi:hypothetical protein
LALLLRVIIFVVIRFCNPNSHSFKFVPMNRVYPLMLTACICMTVILPRISIAQCMCSATVPASQVTYFTSLPPTTQAVANISFPMFNPSIGTLNCVSLKDTISGVTTTYVTNVAPDSVDYKFQLTINNDIEGPGGLSSTSSYSAIYLDTLAADGDPGSSGVNGPDHLFTSAPDSNGTSNTAPYLGVGSVNLTYTINGGLLTQRGGTNYKDSISTIYQGDFLLTYYWCPATELATSITNFTAVPNGNAILLQWIGENQQNNTTYEIQISTDGTNFNTIGEAGSNPAATGSSAKYQYQYNPDQANVGKLYFRIKVTSPSGQVTYSQVLVVDFSADPAEGNPGPISFQTFPNPATNSLLFQFNSNQTGRYLLELVSVSGQVVQQKAVTLTGTSQIRLDLSPQPAKGLYFLRTSDLTRNQSYVTKVFIN